MLQPARADAVRALLVFLDLLKRQAKCVAEIRLAHCQYHPAHAHPAADVLVDGIWGLLADGVDHRFRIVKSAYNSYRDEPRDAAGARPKPPGECTIADLEDRSSNRSITRFTLMRFISW